MSKTRLRTDTELDARTADAATVRDCFNSLQVGYWLSGGALLGAWRDGDFIRWDWDVEFHVKTEQVLPYTQPLMDRLTAAGFTLQTEDSKGESTLVEGRWLIEAVRSGDRMSLVGFDRAQDDMRLHVRHWIPERMWQSDVHVELRGEQFQAQAPVEEFLEWTYGDWRTPKRTSRKREYLTARFRPR